MKQSLSLKAFLTLLFLWGLSFGSFGFAHTNDPAQGFHQDILSEMEEEEPFLYPQAEILWRHTLQRNVTLQLALQKMAEKTGELPSKDKAGWTQAMLQGLIQLGGMGGAIATGNPAPLIGSSVLSRVTRPDETPKMLTAVSSADLVILARELEGTQSQLLLNLVRYRQAQQQAFQLQQTLDRLHHEVKTLSQDSPQLSDMINTIIIDQSLRLQQAQANVETYRNLLVLAAGEDALKEIDNPIQPVSNLEEQPHANEQK